MIAIDKDELLSVPFDFYNCLCKLLVRIYLAWIKMGTKSQSESLNSLTWRLV